MLANLWHLGALLHGEHRDLGRLAAGLPVADIGGADGDLAFLLEHEWGWEVDLIDSAPTNQNGLRGARALRAHLGSRVRIAHLDLDRRGRLRRERYGLVFLLGILYHLQNPLFVLRELSRVAEHCLLSTRVARYAGAGRTPIADLPVAYLVGPEETNNDATTTGRSLRPGSSGSSRGPGGRCSSACRWATWWPATRRQPSTTSARSCCCGPRGRASCVKRAAVGLVAGLLTVCVGAAPAGARALKGMWGPAVHAGASQFPVYRDLGIQVYETAIDWSSVAARRPAHPRDAGDKAYAWPAGLDEAVAASRASGIRVVVQLIGAPGWANGGRPPNWAPRNPADFADFAYAAARRYPTVHLWMVWGEPTRHADYAPTLTSAPTGPLTAAERAAPHRYARMLDAAYGALKQASRANLVIGGMTFTTGDIRTRQWIENLRLPDGRPPRLDLYGHNPFTSRDPSFANPPSPSGDVDFSDLPRLAAWIDRYLGRGRPQIKLFLSEWTIPTAIDDEFNFFVDPAVQARWIADGLRLVRNWSRVYAIGWIHLYDDLPSTGGGLLDAAGVQKPGYLAWKDG